MTNMMSKNKGIYSLAFIVSNMMIYELQITKLDFFLDKQRTLTQISSSLPVSCLLSPVSPVSCLLSPVSCLSCLLSPANNNAMVLA